MSNLILSILFRVVPSFIHEAWYKITGRVIVQYQDSNTHKAIRYQYAKWVPLCGESKLK